MQEKGVLASRKRNTLSFAVVNCKLIRHYDETVSQAWNDASSHIPGQNRSNWRQIYRLIVKTEFIRFHASEQTFSIKVKTQATTMILLKHHYPSFLLLIMILLVIIISKNNMTIKFFSGQTLRRMLLTYRFQALKGGAETLIRVIFASTLLSMAAAFS